MSDNKGTENYLEGKYSSPPSLVNNNSAHLIYPLISNNESPSKLMSLANITTADAALNLSRIGNVNDRDQKKSNTPPRIQSAPSVFPPLHSSLHYHHPVSRSLKSSFPPSSSLPSLPFTQPSQTKVMIQSSSITTATRYHHEQKNLSTNGNNVNGDYTFQHSISNDNDNFIPPINLVEPPPLSDEINVCSNFICCGFHLSDLHALLQHYEEYHVKIEDELIETSSSLIGNTLYEKEKENDPSHLREMMQSSSSYGSPAAASALLGVANATHNHHNHQKYPSYSHHSHHHQHAPSFPSVPTVNAAFSSSSPSDANNMIPSGNGILGMGGYWEDSCRHSESSASSFDPTFFRESIEMNASSTGNGNGSISTTAPLSIYNHPHPQMIQNHSSHDIQKFHINSNHSSNHDFSIGNHGYMTFPCQYQSSLPINDGGNQINLMYYGYQSPSNSSSYYDNNISLNYPPIHPSIQYPHYSHSNHINHSSHSAFIKQSRPSKTKRSRSHPGSSNDFNHPNSNFNSIPSAPPSNYSNFMVDNRNIRQIPHPPSNSNNNLNLPCINDHSDYNLACSIPSNGIKNDIHVNGNFIKEESFQSRQGNNEKNNIVKKGEEKSFIPTPIPPSSFNNFNNNENSVKDGINESFPSLLHSTSILIDHCEKIFASSLTENEKNYNITNKRSALGNNSERINKINSVNTITLGNDNGNSILPSSLVSSCMNGEKMGKLNYPLNQLNSSSSSSFSMTPNSNLIGGIYSGNAINGNGIDGNGNNLKYGFNISDSGDNGNNNNFEFKKKDASLSLSLLSKSGGMGNYEREIKYNNNNGSSINNNADGGRIIVDYSDRHPSDYFIANTMTAMMEKPYKCHTPGCTKSYKNANGLKYHSAHGHDGSERDLDDRPFKCHIPECGKSYKNANGLKYHMAHSHMDKKTLIERIVGKGRNLLGVSATDPSKITLAGMTVDFNILEDEEYFDSPRMTIDEKCL